MTEPNKGVQDGTNELDSILGDEVTPSSSQEQPEATADKAPQKSEEELEFAKLSGSTQDRIRQLIRERDDARKKAETPDKAPLQPTPTQTKTGELTAEQRDAIKQLKEMTGMVTKDELQAVKDNLVVERTYASLEEKYDGSNGLPKFSREEVEDHMRRTGIYNPEKAYKDMYEEEFFDYRMKQASKKKGPYTNGSRASFKGEPISTDWLENRLKQPDGKEWWSKNRDKIMPLMKDLMGA